jgi:hypothetical protein
MYIELCGIKSILFVLENYYSPHEYNCFAENVEECFHVFQTDINHTHTKLVCTYAN